MTVEIIPSVMSYIGLAEDTKPTTGVIAGSKFFELDTGKNYAYSITSGWFEAPVNNLSINPEDYTGTDYEKLQAAFTAAVFQSKAVCISKTYDIEANTISIAKGSDVRKPLLIYGGGKIVKNVAGYMFEGADPATSDVIFDGIWFEGTSGIATSIFNCGDGQLIRLTVTNCYFKNFKNIFYTMTYLQSIKMDKCTAIGISGTVFDVQGVLNVICSEVLVEASNGQFIKHGGTGTYNDLRNFVVRDSCLEGFYGPNPVFEIKNALDLVIDSNYFEFNTGGNIVFDSNAIISGVSISNNVHSGETSSTRAFITWGKELVNCTSTNNTCCGIPVHDTTNAISGKVISTNDHSFGELFSIENDTKYLYRIDNNLISNNVNKVGNNYLCVSLNTVVSTTSWTDLSAFIPYINTGGYITIRGGGIQGNIGVYGLSKAYKYIRSESTITLTADTSSSWGDSTIQDSCVQLVADGITIKLQVKSQNEIATSYALCLEVFGYVQKLV